MKKIIYIYIFAIIFFSISVVVSLQLKGVDEVISERKVMKYATITVDDIGATGFTFIIHTNRGIFEIDNPKNVIIGNRYNISYVEGSSIINSIENVPELQNKIPVYP